METSPLEFMQVALNTCDMAGSLQFYTEVFGFASAGGTAVWGAPMRMQGLEPSDRATVWWLVGRQSTVQLEFFHHTSPPQRPQAQDWSPADHGWTRFGLAVPDFAGTMAKLAAWGVRPLGPELVRRGGRRVAVRDPFAGAVIEVIEETDALPAGLRERRFDFDPFVVYASLSVSDLAESRRFYGQVIGLPILDENWLHDAEDEALWGLPGAARTSFLAAAGEVMLEICEYADPRGRPVAADYLISDQGIMNVGLRTTDPATLAPVFDRLIDEQVAMPGIACDDALLGSYTRGEGRELELLAWPREYDAAFGLAPAAPLLGQTVGDTGIQMLGVDQYLDRVAGASKP